MNRASLISRVGNQMVDPELDRITERIIGCAYKVSNTLGIGFVERVYENSLFHEMKKENLRVVQQYPAKVIYDGIVVGEFFLDMLVNDLVIVELKAVSTLANEHLAQALNYLRATDLPAGLLINFGQSKIQVRRLYPSPAWKSSKS
jgi:GxxExxY protein